MYNWGVKAPQFFRRLGLILATLGSAVFLSAAPALADNLSGPSDIQNGLCSGANLQLDLSNGCQGGGSQTAITKLNNLIHYIINTLSAIVGVVAVIMIIIGGFRYITSGGTDTSVAGAKNTILYAVIGLIIVALAQILVRVVLNKVANT